MSHKVQFFSACGMGLMLSALYAHAGELQVEKASSSPVLTVSEARTSNWSDPVLTEMGAGHASNITSKGSTGLLSATKMIVPKNWRVSAVEEVNPDAPASWRVHDEPWTTAMEQAAESAGVVATVLWAKKTVLIKPGSGAAAKPASTNAVDSAATKQASKKEVSPEPASTPVSTEPVTTPPAADVYAPVPPTFTLPASPSLKNELSRYADSQGWSLRWNIDHDYRVDVPIPLKGDFYTAVTDLVKAYQALGGMAGVVPRFATSNKVLSIENLDHSTRQNQ